MASFLGTLFGGAAEAEAADKNRAALAAYQPQAMGYLKQGYDTGTGALNQGIGAWAPLAALGQKYGSATDMLLNSYGLNGPQGNAAATAAFQAGPGYNWMRDQGLEAVNRRRAGGNMYQSGNADIDTLNFAEGIANQEFKPWQAGLADLGKTGIGALGTAAAGQSSGYTNLANLAQTYGTNQTGIAGNVLSGTMDANKLQAAGEAAGAKNALGAGLSLASLAMGGMGGMGGGAGLGSALFGSAGSVPGAVGATSLGGAPLQSPGLFNKFFG